jgi:hypothetical protein
VPQLFRVNEAVVRERHHALPTEKMATAFRAFTRCLQLLGENVVFGLQRVKHHGLREIFAYWQSIDGDGYVPVFGGTKHSTWP